MSSYDLPKRAVLIPPARKVTSYRLEPATIEDLKTEKCERSLSYFVRQAWHVVEPGTQYQHNWHIDAICAHLEACTAGQIRKLLINIPPRFMKSLDTCVFWPAWTWQRRPQKRWLFNTYAQSLSIRDSIKCRSVILSPWYQQRWGDRYALRHDQNTKTRFDNTATGFRLATSTRGMSTGEGGDFIVFDDPHNVVQGESEKIREAVIDWWDHSMSTRGNDPNTVCHVGIMQRLHQQDLAGHLLERGGYEHLCLPMHYDPKRSKVTSIGWKDPRQAEGELLWPARFGEKVVKTLETALGSYAAAGQLEQLPAPAGGGMFNNGNFRYFQQRAVYKGHEPEPKGLGLPNVFELTDGAAVRRYFAWKCYWFQTCDTASKTKTQNDYTVVGTFAVTPDGDLLVYDIARVKLEVPKQFGFLCAQRAKYPYVELSGVEDTSSGTGLIQQGSQEGVPFKALQAVVDKVTLAGPVATMVENHKVFFLQGAHWLGDYEGELMHFPNGQHDDQVDVTSHAGRIVVQRALHAAGVLSASLDDLPTLQDLLDDIYRDA